MNRQLVIGVVLIILGVGVGAAISWYGGQLASEGWKSLKAKTSKPSSKKKLNHLSKIALVFW